MLFLIMFISVSLSNFSGIWWLFAPVALLAAAWKADTPAQAFWSGAVSNGLCWGGFILIKTIPNENMLATRLAESLSISSWVVLLLISLLIGSLTSGVSAIAGVYGRRLFFEYEPAS